MKRDTKIKLYNLWVDVYNHRIKIFWLIVALIVSIGVFCRPTNAGEIDISFTVTGDDGHEGQATYLLVYYSQTPFDSTDYLTIADTASFCPEPDSAGTKMYCTLTGLEDGQVYFIGVRVGDEVPNWSQISNIVSKTAEDRTAPAAIVDLVTL